MIAIEAAILLSAGAVVLATVPTATARMLRRDLEGALRRLLVACGAGYPVAIFFPGSIAAKAIVVVVTIVALAAVTIATSLARSDVSRWRPDSGWCHSRSHRRPDLDIVNRTEPGTRC